MKKTTIVKTDDPANKKFKLLFTGKVEKVVDIKPAYVYLDGKPGDTLEAVVSITPSEKYKFSILGMEQRENTKIKAELINPKGDEKTWQIKISGTSDKAESLNDVLILKTDSKYKPILKIKVYAVFLAKLEFDS